MDFTDIILWSTGISWGMLALAAVRMARAGDYGILRYLGLVLAVAAAGYLAFPAALAAILGALWLLTLVLPVLLFRRIQRLFLKRRFALALSACRVLPFLQPIGPQAELAAIYRFLCLRELGRREDAERMAAGLSRLPPGKRRSIEALELSSEQRWSEIIALYDGQPATVAGIPRLRARVELGDYPGMLADFQVIRSIIAAQRAVYQHLLAVVLAFAGRADLVAGLLRESAPETRSFWIATALWAGGEEQEARRMLGQITDPYHASLQSAVSWRLAHPPAPCAGLDAEVRRRLADIASLGERAALLDAGRPWLTWGIAAICCAAFLVSESSADPLEALWDLGALDTGLGWGGNWWRFVAASFLHLNVPHIVMNVLGLLVIAPALERTLRWWRFLVLYLGAGIGGMALVQLLSGTGDEHRTLVVGASASLMGLIGGELVRLYRGRLPGEAWWRQRPIIAIAALLVLQSAFDVSHPAVSQSGHIGGFLTGLLLGVLLIQARALRRPLDA